jgi:hypothetical protein
MAKGGYEDQVSAVVAKLLVKHFGAKPRAI